MQQLMLILLALSTPSAEKESKDPQLNLDFEEVTEEGKPAAWYLGGKGYDIGLDREVFHTGRASLCFESKPGARQFAVAKGNFPVALASGKKLIFSGWFKTEDVEEGRIGLWWRVDGREDGKRKILAFDNMYSNPVAETRDWQEYSIELDIPPNGTNINFGVLFTGEGTAWADDLRIVLDGKTYRPR